MGFEVWCDEELGSLTINSTDLAYLFILYMFFKYDVSSYIISNCNSKFIVNFFHLLDTVLDMCLHFTSSYHFESDGQTKYMNQTLE